METIIGLTLVLGHLFLPILGLIWLANRREAQKQQRIFNDSIYALQLIARNRRR